MQFRHAVLPGEPVRQPYSCSVPSPYRLKIPALYIIASQLVKPSPFSSLLGGSVSVIYYLFIYDNCRVKGK
jgi:hypothetical protein